MIIRVHLWLITVMLLALAGPITARADLSQKQARKAIQTMGGWALPGSAVRLQIRTNGAESAEVSAEIETVFRLRLFEGHWQLREIRTAPDRWERLEVIARAAKVEVPEGGMQHAVAIWAQHVSYGTDDKASTLFGCESIGCCSSFGRREDQRDRSVWA